jgi:hypothetical protein
MRRMLGDKNVRKAAEIVAAAAQPVPVNVPVGPIIGSRKKVTKPCRRVKAFMLSAAASDALDYLVEFGGHGSAKAAIEDALIRAAAPR